MTATMGPAGAPLRQRPAWRALQTHHAAVRDRHLRELFAGYLEMHPRGPHAARVRELLLRVPAD